MLEKTMRNGYVYIMTNQPYGTLYIGVTSNLMQRVYQHIHNLVEGYTKTHKLYHLAYHETHERIDDAIQREKNMKAWKRPWKLRQIMSQNQDWSDPYNTLIKHESQPALGRQEAL